MIFSKYADNPHGGHTIYDTLTKEIFSDEEAHRQSDEIKSRLAHMANICGAWVHTIKELEEIERKKK